MNDFVISKYANYFKTLNRGYNKGLGRAPHKPILLLSIIQLIKTGNISSNRIFISPDLILAFKNNWNKLVETGHTSNFALPFFHLRNEPFWYLITKTGMEIAVTKSKSIKSFKSLNESIAFAEIDKELFLLLASPITNIFFEELILDTFFPYTKYKYSSSTINDEENRIENQILNDPKIEYQSHIKKLRELLDDDDFEEELFVRGGLFKKAIPKIYNYTCCISGMKIESTKNAQMVDACHIIPFSLSNDDTITNGISLSPNLHRAFDRGLITINKDYIVRLSPSVTDNESVYSISQFDGQKISLPEKANWFPSPESLVWHNKEVFVF